MQKWHPTWMASNNYIIGFLKHYQFNNLLIKPTPTIRYRRVIRISLWSGKNLTLKSNYHESEQYNKFKNFLLKITQAQSLANITFGHFFARCAIFVRHHFCGYHMCLFQVEYLPCAIFVRCHYFQMTLKGAIFVGFIWLLFNCNYLLFYQ